MLGPTPAQTRPSLHGLSLTQHAPICKPLMRQNQKWVAGRPAMLPPHPHQATPGSLPTCMQVRQWLRSLLPPSHGRWQGVQKGPAAVRRRSPCRTPHGARWRCTKGGTACTNPTLAWTAERSSSSSRGRAQGQGACTHGRSCGRQVRVEASGGRGRAAQAQRRPARECGQHALGQCFPTSPSHNFLCILLECCRQTGRQEGRLSLSGLRVCVKA